MKAIAQILFFLFCCIPFINAQYWTVTEKSPMPEAVGNNAVVEAVVNAVPYVYSFAGIDSTKLGANIHLRSYRYNTQTDVWESIPALPDTLGKIGVAASRIGDIIYIMGGYHVVPTGEISSNKVHRYDVVNNTYLSDGAPIPLPIDDQVQVVWRDSLIYIVTGWSGDIGTGGNVSNVQIYDPANDSWQTGSSVPSSDLYTAFGASGVIIEDTIFYYGGAAGFNFGITGILRKGLINPNNPAQVAWIALNGDPVHQGYRMAATTVEGNPYWLGGSSNTYNFDGIAYDGSGGVDPANRSIFYDLSTKTWQVDLQNKLPMDLRGVASISDTVKYLAGGMLENQKVSNKTYLLERSLVPVVSKVLEVAYEKPGFLLFPNPSSNQVNIEATSGRLKGLVEIWDAKGALVLQKNLNNQRSTQLSLANLAKGLYWLRIGKQTQKLLIE